MKITKIDLLYCDPVEGGWRPIFMPYIHRRGNLWRWRSGIILWRRFTGCICHVKRHGQPADWNESFGS